MKRVFLILFQVLLMVSCASTANAAGDKKTAVLDWQYKDEGSEIPAWVTAVAQSDKKKIAKELEFEDCKFWALIVSGENLEMLETFDSVAGVTDAIAREMTVQINEESISRNTISEISTESVLEMISETDIRGLQRVESFWIKTGTLKKGLKKAKKESDYQVKFNYYSVWVMNSDLYEVQLKRVMDGIAD